MNEVREQVLEGFILPFGLAYWNYIIFIAVLSIIISAIINKVPVTLDRVRGNNSRREAKEFRERNKKPKKGG